MLTRFDFERAFVDPAAALGPASRHLLHVLAMRLDKDQFAIPARYQPSLNELARDMGCNRRTVMRRLNRVEKAGWVLRDRPTEHEARTRHVRTRYTLRVPPYYLEARGSKARELGAESPGPGGVMPLELGAVKREAGGVSPRKSSESSPSSDGDLDVIIREIAKRTGRAIGRLPAARVREEIFAGARDTVANPAAYLRTSIQREPDPARWLPTPTPPPFAEYDPRAGTREKETQ